MMLPTWSNAVWMVVYILCIYGETYLKTASGLMMINAHIAPNWYFGGLIRSFLELVPFFGAQIASAALSYSYFYVLGWWSILMFFILLFIKKLISDIRSGQVLELTLAIIREANRIEAEEAASSGRKPL